MIEAKYTELEMRLRAECEQDFAIGPKTAGPVDFTIGTVPYPEVTPTGEAFKQLGSPPVKVTQTDEATYEQALAAFRDYARDRKGTLYWRIYPEIERGRFYMRLLISDRPLASPQEMS